MFTLRAIGGLCNRLQAILSYRAREREIVCVWHPDEYVSFARWQDAFEPLEGVTFVDDGPCHKEDWSIADGRIGAWYGWMHGYLEVRPSKAVRERLAMLPTAGYVAMHVRRTDHVPNMLSLGIRPESLGDFRAWAAQWPSRGVYLATDNRDTQDSMMSEPRYFSGTSFNASPELQDIGDHHRNGSLEDAAVDLFMCVQAERFMGSDGSSFTGTIQIMRGFRR
jgi:hypothetical protein